MRIIRLALAAVFAVLAFGAMAAGSASAFVPLFLTESKAELLFTASGGTATLRGLNVGTLGTITCEKSSGHGFALDKSTLAHRVKIQFEGKCKQVVGSNEGTCKEPIVVKETLAELGLVGGTGANNHTVLLLVIPSGGPKFVTTECTNGNTTVEGAVIGEFPEENAARENQYNSLRSSAELVFEAEGQNTDKQKYTKIELLGVTMPGELKVEGFFGGKASEEATSTVTGDGGIEICTKTPGNCP